MLTRQKTILGLLSQTDKPLNLTMFVKFMFLLRHETVLENDRTFYDFVPYKYGPFSFVLYQELANLRRDGYITPDEESVSLCEDTTHLTLEKVKELPSAIRQAIKKVITCYGEKNYIPLVRDVYTRYPWYATKSELTDLRSNPSYDPVITKPAVYTAGYEGKSVDFFFNHLLKKGIELIIDVRANPISRHYGFSKRQFSEISKRLGLDYLHIPNLGIPSKYRINLKDYSSYQRLLNYYEQELLPELKNEIQEVGDLMQNKPSVLVCVERDVTCCHRSRLAKAISRKIPLEVMHL